MYRHTTFKIGGPAALFLTPDSTDSMTALCTMLKETGAKHFFLGNGSNVLFDDGGFDGAVISLAGLNSVSADGNMIRAEAGASVASVCKAAREASLTGLEFAFGIPGTVGGAVYMNAGAYGGETAFVLTESTYLDLDTLTVCTIPLTEHSFGYRESVYKHTKRLILSAEFTLTEGKREEIAALMADYMNRRVTKQPLEYPSAGSVFKRYPGRYTGQMIDESGLKGYTIGGAQVSEKHAGFIINKGGATAKDVLDLIAYIKKVILENYGCELECEVIHVK
ncbi:MAG: UDP-N-acetylmuramate dehydrogenase [Clostridia bacterium]|nr:UDP-N-acetylmuramate dehydrogenase [Clostridia bacterium]